MKMLLTRRIKALVSAAVILAVLTGIQGLPLLSVSAAPPVNSEVVYDVSEFEPLDEGTVGSQHAGSITGQDNLIAFTRGPISPSNPSKFKLDTHPGREGTFLRDGKPDGTATVRNTVIEPLAYADGSNSYPVIEISGYRTLSTHTSSVTTGTQFYSRASAFFAYKMSTYTEATKTTVDSYYGPTFVMGASEALGLTFWRPNAREYNASLNFQTVEDDVEDDVVTANPLPVNLGAHVPTYANSSTTGNTLQNYLISVDDVLVDDEINDLRSEAAAEFARKTSLKTGEEWVFYRLYLEDGVPGLELTLELDIPDADNPQTSVSKKYKFNFPIFAPAPGSDYSPNLAIGNRHWTAATTSGTPVNTPGFYDDFTVKYDTSSYIPEAPKLTSLSVSGGDIDPAFDADTFEYMVIASDGATAVEITAVAENSAAITGDGEVTLTGRTTTHQVVVGNNERVYTLTILRMRDKFTLFERLRDILLKRFNFDPAEDADLLYFLDLPEDTAALDITNLMDLKLKLLE